MANWQVKILHLLNGNSGLGGNKSVYPATAGNITWGPKMADYVTKMAGGYRVGWNGKHIFIHDAAVDYAELYDPEEAAKPAAPKAAPALEVERPPPAEPKSAMPNANGIVVDARGVHSRVAPATPPGVQAAPKPESDEPVTHRMVRKERGRRGPTPTAA